jgi:hypothetical protein
MLYCRSTAGGSNAGAYASLAAALCSRPGRRRAGGHRGRGAVSRCARGATGRTSLAGVMQAARVGHSAPAHVGPTAPAHARPPPPLHASPPPLVAAYAAPARATAPLPGRVRTWGPTPPPGSSSGSMPPPLWVSKGWEELSWGRGEQSMNWSQSYPLARGGLSLNNLTSLGRKLEEVTKGLV